MDREKRAGAEHLCCILSGDGYSNDAEGVGTSAERRISEICLGTDILTTLNVVAVPSEKRN